VSYFKAAISRTGQTLAAVRVGPGDGFGVGLTFPALKTHTFAAVIQ